MSDRRATALPFPGRARSLAVAAVMMIAVLSIVMWWNGQPALLAPVGAIIGVCLPLTRRLPGTVAFMASMIFVAAFYLAAMLGLGLLLAVGPLRPVVAIGILLAPCLGIGVDLILGTRPASGRRDDLTHPLVPLSALVGPTLLLLAVGVAVAFQGRGAVAFAMSGDARNHLLIARQILSAGGIGTDILAAFPPLSEAVVALMTAVHGRVFMGPEQVLMLDLQVLAGILIMGSVAWSLAGACVIGALGTLSSARQAVVVASASMIPLAGLGLGIALRDGFVSIVFLMPLLMSALGLSMWLARGTEPAPAKTLVWLAAALSLPVVTATWSFMAPIGAMVIMAALIASSRNSTHRETVGAACMALGAAASALLLVVPLAGSLRGVTNGGSIAAPPPALFIAVSLLVISIVAAGLPRITRWAFLPYGMGTLGAGAIVLFMAVQQPAGSEWNYYPAKVAWIWVLVGFSLLLVPAAFVRARPAATSSVTQAHRLLLAVAGSLGVLALVVSSSGVGSPLLPVEPAAASSSCSRTTDTASIVGGWRYPDARIAEAVLEYGAIDRPLAFWAYTDPLNDRMGNFWMSTYDQEDPQSPQFQFSPFGQWAYGSPCVVERLCELLNQDPRRTVVTRDAALPGYVERQCNVPPGRVWLDP